jgi:RNA ligase (TIGR02306 family)
MNGFKVNLTKILDIVPHTNADRLEVAQIYGFNVVIKKDSLKIGDEVFYIPIDSIISEELENIIFPEGSKIKLNKRRVRQITIRKFASQGMILSKEDVEKIINLNWKLETDYSKKLGITKYEPPTPSFQKPSGQVPKRKINPYFKKYGGITNFKWFPERFNNTIVTVSEKIHGSSIKFGYTPFYVDTLWKKIKKFFNLIPEFEWVYGSNNVQLNDSDNNAYNNVLKKYKAKMKVPNDYVVYGELYGDGIQKGYKYGCKNEHKLIIFDVKYKGGYVSFTELQNFGKKYGFDVVPEIYNGMFDFNKIKKMTLGNSIICPSQSVREGVVIKSVSGERKILKLISEKYLSKDQSDFH